MLRRPWCLSISTTIALTLFVSVAVSAPIGYTQTNLVSDIPNLAANTDPNLVNPWGISSSPGSPFWVSDNGMVSARGCFAISRSRLFSVEGSLSADDAAAAARDASAVRRLTL